MVKIFLTLAIILSLQSTTMFAQENNTINKIKNDTSGIIELPSLQEIYAIALQYSPFIKSEKGLIDIKKRELKSVKNDWLDLVKIGGNYNLRENKNIYNYPETDLTNSVNNLNNVYGVGVSFQISLYTILNRRNEVKISKIKYENQQNIYDNSLQLFKNQINTYYLDVKMKEDIYVLSIESLSVANVTHNYAELELKNNNIDLEDYSSIHERKVRMQQSYFVSKKEYLEALSILEVTIGQNLR